MLKIYLLVCGMVAVFVIYMIFCPVWDFGHWQGVKDSANKEQLKPVAPQPVTLADMQRMDAERKQAEEQQAS